MAVCVLVSLTVAESGGISEEDAMVYRQILQVLAEFSHALSKYEKQVLANADELWRFDNRTLTQYVWLLPRIDYLTRNVKCPDPYPLAYPLPYRLAWSLDASKVRDHIPRTRPTVDDGSRGRDGMGGSVAV